MKIKPITLYCVVDSKKPILKYGNIIQPCDKNFQVLHKGEKVVKLKVNVV